VGGQRIIDRVAAALRPLTDALVLCANDPRAAQWLPGVAVVPDTFHAKGGLAGVESGLGEAAARGHDALCVAWDMPFITTELLASLAAHARAHDLDAVLPASESPHGFEPFCGFYAGRVHAALRDFLAGGGSAAHAFLRGLDRVHFMTRAQLGLNGGERRPYFLSVNSAGDLERARTLAGDAQ
jgi:molybdopterin-guanine dinucleotide biosynthesis protein A